MTGKLARAFLICVLLVAGAQIVRAADIEVKSEVQPKEVSVNGYVTVRVTISGSDAGKAKTPILEPTPGFTVLDQPEFFQSTTIVNLSISVEKSYTFTLKPNKIGTFEIGGATIPVGREQVKVSPKTVKVVRQQSSQSRQQSAQSQRGETRDRSGDNGIFIKSFVDNETPYVGQQITHTFELYDRLTIMGDNAYSPPSTTGFWSVDLPGIPTKKQIIDGNIYQYTAKKTALFPTTSGELTIGEASLTYIYGGFFSTRRRRRIITDPITVTVKPLPENGKPADFGGAVGNYEIKAVSDKTELKAGDVVTMKVTVAGTGNLDLVTSLKTPNFSAFKTYDPKVGETISNSGLVIGGGKTWEYVLSPKYQGDITIERFSLSFFDPADKSYHTISTDPILLRVLPGEASAFTETTRKLSQQAVETLASDIRFIKPDKTTLKSARRRIYSNVGFYLIYAVPLTVFAAAFVVKRRRDAIERDTGLKRSLSAWKKAQKRVSEAERLRDTNNIREFCGALRDAVTDFIGDRLNIDSGTMTTTALETALIRKSVPKNLAERTRKTLELCDFVRFSSDYSGVNIQKNLLNDTRNLLESLRNML